MRKYWIITEFSGYLALEEYYKGENVQGEEGG